MKKRSKATQTLRAGCADPQTNTQTGAITIRCAAVSLARSAMEASPIKEGIRLSRISSCSFIWRRCRESRDIRHARHLTA